MISEHYPNTVAIIGAGPAGLSAAQVLGDYGVPVTVLEESSNLGGQYYRPALATNEESPAKERLERKIVGQELVSNVQRDSTSIETEAIVWGLFPDKTIGIAKQNASRLASYERIIVATGAQERFWSFPGWTLPGVTAAAGLQTLISRDLVLPGNRFVVAGTGPLLQITAEEIAHSGGFVSEVVEGNSTFNALRQGYSLFMQSGRVRQALSLRRSLTSHGAELTMGHAVVEARGEGHVEEVIVAKINSDWSPITGSERSISADALCIHYGFVPAIQLAAMAGCAVRYDEELGGWIVDHDAGMRSSEDGIYVAGQVTGIGGVERAIASGTLAGLTAAQDLGVLTSSGRETRIKEVQRKLERANSDARTLNRTFTPGPGLSSIISPRTLICRCEDVSAVDIDSAIDAGASTLNDLKRRTRCGMGPCQGRVCASLISSYLRDKHRITPENAGTFRARPPIRPIPFTWLLETEGLEQPKSRSR